MDFTKDEKIAALDREIALRQRVYPRLIRQGRMLESDADREIMLMTAIRDDYSSRDIFARYIDVADAIAATGEA